MEFIEIVITVFYTLSLLLIFLFSLGQLHLTLYYLRARRKRNKNGEAKADNQNKQLPYVTVQLPIFNEKYVVRRLIEAAIKLEYPAHKLEIQILDDSSDETTQIVNQVVDENQSCGITMVHIRRKKREGFKAGALQDALGIAKGELLAIFDADFLPRPDFLLKTIPHFADPSVGVVQTRWSYVNEDYSLLTGLQAFGLDAHFTIEQTGRSEAGSFINFNGTAGVWNKACIIDSGGWSYDTLTEDLDLSYRAQMKGWKFKYLEETDSPSELPVIMPAIKTQQYRWNKGAAESAMKNLGNIFKMHLPLLTKVHAMLHLLNSSVFIPLFLAAILSVPMLFLKQNNPDLVWLFNWGTVFLIGFFAIGIYYWVAAKRMRETGVGKYFLSHFFPFLAVTMGLSLHNALAAIEGLLGIRSSFIRTPKFNIESRRESWRSNTYVSRSISIWTWAEGLLSLYFLFGILYGLQTGDVALLFFHIFLAAGFSIVFIYSLIPNLYGNPR